MKVDREIIESVIKLLNKAFDYEGDVFGVQHNEAVDTLNELEQIIKDVVT